MFKKLKKAKKYLLFSIIFFTIGIISLGLFLYFFDTVAKEEQTMQSQMDKINQIGDSVNLTTTGSENLFELLESGFVANFKNEQDKLIHSGALDVLKSYFYAYSSDISAVKSGFKLSEQAIEKFEDAIMLTDDKGKYMQLQKNLLTAKEVHLLNTVKLCYQGLSQAMDVIFKTDTFLSEFDKLLAEELVQLLYLLQGQKSPKIKDCIVSLSKSTATTKKSIGQYQKLFSHQGKQISKNYQDKLDNPKLCLSAKGLVLDVGLSGDVAEELLKTYQNHLILLDAIKNKDYEMILEFCKNLDANSQNNKTNEELKKMAKEFQDLQGEKDAKKNKKDEKDKNSKSSKKGKNTKDGANGEENHKKLNKETEDIMRQIKGKGESWYKNAKKLQKNNNYSSYDEIKKVFRKFYGYDEDFKQEDTDKKDGDFGY